MDVGSDYVKMCEKAEEIQALAPLWEDYNRACRATFEGEELQKDYSFTSLFWLPQEKEVALLHFDNDENRWMIGDYHQEAEGAIWLPRQDQLQDMIKSSELVGVEEDDNGLLSKFALGFVYRFDETGEFDGQSHYSKCFTSMEQLWLAFVMGEKYGKYWDTQEENWELIAQKEMRERYLGNANNVKE